MKIYTFLGLALGIAQSTIDPDSNCCVYKKVGEYSYKYIGKESSALDSRCSSNCVYEREDRVGSKFCFSEGNMMSSCQDVKKPVNLLTPTCTKSSDSILRTFQGKSTPDITPALIGCDAPNYEPMPTSIYHPWEKQSIFIPTTHPNGDIAWPQVINKVSCNTELSAESWDDYQSYILSSGSSDTLGASLTVGRKTKVSLKKKGVGISQTIPPLFSGGISDSNQKLKIEKHFEEHKGSIVRVSAACSIIDVQVDIDDGAVLHPSFIDALLEIDRAIKEKQEEEVKELANIFIQKFGTHYNKRTVLGVGFDYESRYTKQQIQDSTLEERKKCTSGNAKISAFGASIGGDGSDCTSSLKEQGSDLESGLKSSAYHTIGTLPPQNWSTWPKDVLELMFHSNLNPLPIKQVLEPMTKLIGSQLVKNVKDEENNPIDSEKLYQAITIAYKSYCQNKGCGTYGCSDKVIVRLGIGINALLYEALGEILYFGRKVFINNVNNNFLFFDSNNWVISSSLTGQAGYDFKELDCPQTTLKFQDPVGQIQMEILNDNWQECALQCNNYAQCAYWQYESSFCTLMEDFGEAMTINVQDGVFAGTKNCPTKESIANSIFGLCVENSPDMWIKAGSESPFLKNSSIYGLAPGLPVVFNKTEEFDMSKNNQLKTLPSLGKQFIITFQLQLTSFECGGYDCSVIRFGLGNDAGAYGDRTPAVWISNPLNNENTFTRIKNTFLMSAAINGNEDFSFVTPMALLGFELNRFYDFEFSQLLVENEYKFSIRISGGQYFNVSMTNQQPRKFDNVKLFAGDPWYAAAPGQIRNLVVRTKDE